MAVVAAQLTEIGKKFLASMNARDYPSAAVLYASDATYESPSAPSLVGRDQIMGYFMKALDGDDKFQLVPLDQFTGLNTVVLVSSAIGRVFIDVLRTDDAGLIVEHREVSPKQSPIDFLTLGPHDD